MSKHWTLLGFTLTLVLAGVVISCCGCGDSSAFDRSRGLAEQAEMNRHLREISASLDGINATLKVALIREPILPWRRDKTQDGLHSVVVPSKGNNNADANTNTDADANTASAPDLKAALGHGLQMASDLCGRDRVIEFFENMGSDVRKTLVPVDPLGVADRKARELTGKKINELLTQ